MRIPKSGLERFVREIANQCLSSQRSRVNRYNIYQNYFLYGADTPDRASIYNKTFAYIDDLESLLYSPVSLRWRISDPDLPNIVEEAKGRAAASKLRNMARKSETDTCISAAVGWSLVKGKTIIKQTFKRGMFSPTLIQPDVFGVRNESHDKLDEDMEAFCHSMLITTEQFARIVWNHPDKDSLLRKAKRHMRNNNQGMASNDGKQVVVGALYPFQQAGSNQSQQNRGFVDWMGGGAAQLAPEVWSSMLELNEVWIWDDEREDWATFQIVGDDMLIMGKYQLLNALAYNRTSLETVPELRGKHPFIEFCPNPTDGYFWGRSEIVNVALLQEALNSRINGINGLLRKQEDPSIKATGASGVNQNAIARFKKPGGFWTDTNPNAKMELETPDIPGDLWTSITEYERMFDEMGGLPPIAKGHGESGVRSQGHAETLVRMFSPRFKDRALLIERSVESIGALMIDEARVHCPDRLLAWVPQASAGVEAEAPNPLIIPPAEGLAAVPFTFADLSDELVCTVDAHSASPAFQAEAKSLIFDLFKIGAASAEDVVEHTDSPSPDSLVAGIQRRAVEKALEVQKLAESDPKAAMRAIEGGRKK